MKSTALFLVNLVLCTLLALIAPGLTIQGIVHNQTLLIIAGAASLVFLFLESWFYSYETSSLISLIRTSYLVVFVFIGTILGIVLYILLGALLNPTFYWGISPFGILGLVFIAAQFRK
jgi:hypothetical protein